MKLNNLWLGFSVGIIAPVIAFAVFVSQFKTLSLGEFVSQMRSLGLLTEALSICALPSFFLFFVFYWKHYNRSAQGVVAAALLITLVLVIMGI